MLANAHLNIILLFTTFSGLANYYSAIFYKFPTLDKIANLSTLFNAFNYKYK